MNSNWSEHGVRSMKPVQFLLNLAFVGIVIGILFGGTIESVQAETRVIYVSLSGAHQPPFTNWPMASTSIHDAVSAAGDGDLVLASNGVYQLTNQVVIRKGVVLRSVNGPKTTVVQGNWPAIAHRCFVISVTNAVLDGFTIMKGGIEGPWSTAQGGGLRVDAGTVQNCVIVSNQILGNGTGGGLICSGLGVVKKCEIYDNTAIYGGGVQINGSNAVISECWIRNNFASGRSGGIEAGGKALVLNCVVVSNFSGGGGGFYEYDGIFRESILYYNQPNNWMAGSGTTISATLAYVCTTPMHASSNDIGNLTEEPLPDELQTGGVMKILRRKMASLVVASSKYLARLQDGARFEPYRDESRKVSEEWAGLVKTSAKAQATDGEVRLAMRTCSDLLKRTELLYYKISMELLFETEKE